MIKIIDYSDRYDEKLMKLDMMSFLNIKYHRDVILKSVCLAADGDEIIGVGMLKAGATFLKIDEEELRYYFIHADFLADEGADAEAQVIASGMLIEELKKRFDKIQDSHKGKRLILRVWTNAMKKDYLEFLMSYGFRPMRVTPIMARELTDEDMEAYSEDEPVIRLKGGEKLAIREMDPDDENFAKEYIKTNREAFEVEDSINELRFVMGGEDSHVFAVMKGERVIAALTTWTVSEGRAATENIFCAQDYRQKGVTSALIQYALGFLRSRGYEQASLTVFGDNQPATQLYLKLGYEVEGTLLECHYERDYKNIGF